MNSDKFQSELERTVADKFLGWVWMDGDYIFPEGLSDSDKANPDSSKLIDPDGFSTVRFQIKSIEIKED